MIDPTKAVAATPVPGWDAALRTGGAERRPAADAQRPASADAGAPAARMGVGSWEPMWLGDAERAVYASLHRASGAPTGTGVVFAAPLFHEQPRSRRLLAEVASALASLGLASIRFDYHGTGDSGGDGEALDFASIATDLDLAVAGLRRECNVSRIVVLAWRGAALPLMHWLEAGARPDLAVMWEPILDGAEWMRRLEQADATERASPHRYRVQTAEGIPGDSQLMGVPVSRRLREEITRTRVTRGSDPGGPRRWAAVRDAGAGLLPGVDPVFDRVFDLPGELPAFDGGTQMDAGLFVTPQFKQVTDVIAHAIREGV